LNAGVAEQNMTGVAAGLAMMGKIVFTYSIAVSYTHLDVYKRQTQYRAGDRAACGAHGHPRRG